MVLCLLYASAPECVWADLRDRFVNKLEKKRIFAEKETFSSIPVDGKCRNASGPVEALQQ